MKATRWSCETEIWFDRLLLADGRSVRQHCEDDPPNSSFISINFRGLHHPITERLLPKPELAPPGWRLN